MFGVPVQLELSKHLSAHVRTCLAWPKGIDNARKAIGLEKFLPWEVCLTFHLDDSKSSEKFYWAVAGNE